MITDAILTLSSIPFELIFWIIPDITFSILTDMNNAIIYLFSYVNALDFIFPVSAFFSCLIFVVYFEILMFGIRIGMFVLKFVPLFGSVGIDQKGTEETYGDDRFINRIK